MTEKDKQSVFEGCHCAELHVGGGHFGRDKTFYKISERFYWRGMVDDVKEFCKMCDKCQRANRYVICTEAYYTLSESVKNATV